MSIKDDRECWLIHEFRDALSKQKGCPIDIECGEEGSSDGRLVIEGRKVPVQIVSADGIRYVRSACARVSRQVIVYDVKPIEWIKHALEVKTNKNYTDANELTLLIEHYGLDSINMEYLSRELADTEIQALARHFKEVYILSPSDSKTYGERYPAQSEAILFRIPIIA